MERVLTALMDLVVPPASMVMLAFAWPTLSFLRALEWAMKALTKEDMRGKVVLVTGASSAIGEQVAYEYARRGANLVLVARREHRLFAVRENARALGAGHVLVVAADVVREDDCGRLVADTIGYFGQLDHLVNTVSLGHDFLFEEAGDTAAFPHLMDINFWGNVYPTHAALPYLRQSHGRVVVNASVDTWLPMPRMSLYSAAKAAVIDFYETLRYEVKDEVGITVATHGWVGGEPGAGTGIGTSRFALEEGAGVADQTQTQAQAQQWTKADTAPPLPAPGGQAVEAYARAVVDGACRGDARVRRPGWYDVFHVFRAFAPDVLGWTFRLLLSTAPAPPTVAGSGRRALVVAPVGAPAAALPAPPVRPLIEYPAAAAGRRPAAAQLHKLE
ncbi:11-beta-hydroxysteroid dehydrogenase B-like [Triticum dicoccoides]|uniref:11-beta-hydroxysteroid dehydrogenase B-like n=1 Tax=Triticum dicoccoides TaxID=85692 RepID=UPI00162ED419|nr:11-beta-hydroxysteroid dehydrogenase B-like [Triticum dicoccoides]